MPAIKTSKLIAKLILIITTILTLTGCGGGGGTATTTPWVVASLIENDNTGEAYAPQIASSGNGTTVAVWTQDDGSVNNINSNVYK